MDCIIPGQNVKVFAKALQALAKIGDELFIEASKEKLSLLTFNNSKIVCAKINLLDSFFSKYVITEDSHNASNGNLITCKIQMKIILPVFKGTHLEKKWDFVKLDYQPNSDILVLKQRYKTDEVTMEHKLRLMELELLSVDDIVTSSKNQLSANCTFYTQILSMFSGHDSDITFEISKDKVCVRNYCEGAPQRPKAVRSQVKLNASEFNLYRIQSETTINFSLKPLRTAIQFADGFNMDISFEFDKGGRPLTIIMRNPTFNVSFMVATVDPYNDAASTVTCLTSVHVQENNKTMHNLTTDDIAALENENWNDEEFNLPISNHQTSSSKIKEPTSFKALLEKANRKSSVLSRDKENLVKKSETSNNKTINFLNSFEENANDCYEETNHGLGDLPQLKRARLCFKRTFEATFHDSLFNQDILAPASDSE